MRDVIEFIKKEIVLFVFLFLFIILSVLHPYEIASYPSFVDWKTIIALTGLLIITTGLKESNFFFVFSKKLLMRLKTEKSLSLFMILLSALLSTFLTNDITLFIVIPLTISMQNIVKNDISKLVIFEAISVNVGSALTPIGNPQNIFLWHRWGISFITFIVKMLPLVTLLLGTLLIFARFVFPEKELKILERSNDDMKQDKVLFTLSIALLIVYVLSIEAECTDLVLLPIFVLFLIFYRRVLLKVDWLLLLLFAIIFVDFHIIASVSIISKSVNTINLHSAGNVFLFSALTSQLFSNVPASVFVSKFTHNWTAITYGVNVGGNGLAIASLANIIALRMMKSKKIWIKFHRYSIPYFLITGWIVYAFFYVL